MVMAAAPQPLAVEPEAGVEANGTPARARRAPRGADAAVEAHVARISSSRAGKRGGGVDENTVTPNVPLPKVQRPAAGLALSAFSRGFGNHWLHDMTRDRAKAHATDEQSQLGKALGLLKAEVKDVRSLVHAPISRCLPEWERWPIRARARDARPAGAKARPCARAKLPLSGRAALSA